MRKLCLVILDGYGVAHTFDNDESKRAFDGTLISSEHLQTYNIPTIIKGEGESFDAVATSTYDKFRELFTHNPYTLLNASSYFVGLPFAQMGNSEVGHLNIGAGQVVKQDLIRINDAIITQELNKKLKNIQINEGADLHFIGLVSNGGVHSHINHLFACIDYFKNINVNVYIHFISDGRDTDPKSGVAFAKSLCEKIKSCTNIKIASLSGRYYAMDREKNYDRTQMYYNCITNASLQEQNLEEVFAQNYAQGVTDEFIEPINISKSGAIKENDSVLLFNFRADRMRQITQLLSKNHLKLYSMTSYSDDFTNVNVLFNQEVIESNLSATISQFDLKQLKVAEQSKYAHVTYFLNGGIETPYKDEDRVLVDMVDVKTFDLKPEMSAEKVKEQVQKGMDKGYDFICVNFANCDMVGHTGVLDACKIAVETVTRCAYELVCYAKQKDYIVVITADHGNAEIMKTDGKPHTAHTNNKVPFIVLNANKNVYLKPNGSLCNIKPTILELMEIK